MQAIFGKNYKGGIKLRSYCKDHSPLSKTENGLSDQTDTIDANGVKEIDMTNLADDRLQEGNEDPDYFWKYVDINEVHKKISEIYAHRNDVACDEASSDDCEVESKPNKNKLNTAKSKHKGNKLPKSEVKKAQALLQKTGGQGSICREVDPLVIDLIYRYWMLLRTANNSQSLIKFSPSALKEREFEQRKSIMRLRIELERVRNLSYMIGKREKLKLGWLKTHQSIIKHTFSLIDDLNPISDGAETPAANRNNVGTSNLCNNRQSNQHHDNHPNQITPTSPKKHARQALHLQPTNGLFDESDQLINDLLTCDQIYELPNASSHTNSNYNNLSYQERCTLEGRRTLSLVRRINRQLKNIRNEPKMNPYAKSYLVPKRSNSPVGPATSAAVTQQQHTTNKILK